VAVKIGNGQVNPKLMRSIRVWQWRWMISKAKKKTFGDHWSLFAEAHGHVKGGKHRAGVDQKINEKSQGNLVTFSYFFWNRSIVSLWRKQHFFQNAHNRWRGFPPDRMFL